MNNEQFKRLVEIDDILLDEAPNKILTLENERLSELKLQKLLKERALILKLHKEEQTNK